MEKDFHLHNSFAFWLSRLTSVMQENFNRRLEEFQVSWPQWMLLNALDNDMGHTPAQIAVCLGIDRSAITRLVDRLENKSLVIREHDKLDRRSVNIFMTPQGKRVIGQLNALAYEHQQHFLSQLHSSECRALKGELQKMLRAGGLDSATQWRLL